MNEFEKYYNRKFRQDIQTFFSKIPKRSKHTFDDRKIFTVQYQTFTKDFDYLGFLNKEMKAYFGAALFFTVLVDQVSYSHYQDYKKFQNLTRYPKFVGNSPSTDRTNLPPRDIFSAFNYSRDKENMFKTENVEFWTAFNEGKTIMKKETFEFLEKHLSQIDGEEFWSKCERELPHHP